MDDLTYARRRVTQNNTQTGLVRAPQRRPARLSIATMRAALPEFADRSDRDLVELWSQANNIDFAQLADEVGLPKSSDVGEIVGQFGQGFRTDVPRMFGGAVQYLAPEGSALEQWGADVRESAERRGRTSLLDPRGGGLIRNEILAPGARALAPTATTISAAFIPYVGAPLSVAGSAILFGGSAAQDTYEKVLEATGDRDSALAASRWVFGVQGLGETAATYAGARLLRPAAATVSRATGRAPTTAGIARDLTDQRIARPALTSALSNTATQVGTEIAQDFGTALIEEGYGAERDSFAEIARQSGLPALGMSILMGPFALRGVRARAQSARRLEQAINGDPSVTPEEQVAALQLVTAEARRRGVADEDVTTWVREQLLPAENRKTETLDRMENIRAQLALTPMSTPESDRLTAELRTLYDAPSGEFDPETNSELSNGELMARELNAYRLLAQEQQAAQDDGEAEVDLTAAAQETPDAEALFNDIVGRYDMLSLEQLESIDTNMIPAELRREFTVAVDMAKRTGIGLPTRAANLRRAMDILERVAPADTMQGGAGWVRQQQDTTQAETETDLTARAFEQVQARNAALNAESARPAQDIEQVQRGQEAPNIGVADGFSRVQELNQAAEDAEASRSQQRIARAFEQVQQRQPTEATATGFIANTEQSMRARTDAELKAIVGDSQLPTYQRNAASRVLEQRNAAAQAPARQPTATPTAATTPVVSAEAAAAAEQTSAVETEDLFGLDIPPPAANETRTQEETARLADTAAEAEDAALEAILKSSGLLKSEVEGDAAAPKSPGARAFPQQVYAAIRNAILNPTNKGMYLVRKKGVAAVDPELTEQYAPIIARVAKAANEYGKAYDTFLAKAGNLVRSKDRLFGDEASTMAELNALMRVGGSEAYVASELERIKETSPAAYTALTSRAQGRSIMELLEDVVAKETELVDAVGGNRRNIDAIVAAVKQRVQTAKAGTIDTNKSKRWTSTDLRLSRAWNASRRGMQNDVLDVRSSPLRAAKEAKIPVTPLQVVYNEQILDPTMGGRTNILGVAKYFEKNGTSYEKLLGGALARVFESMGDSAPTFSLVVPAKGKKSAMQYDPAKNNIVFPSNASPSVALHEALHGALQWYVYNNPLDQNVQDLKELVKQVVEMDMSKSNNKAQAVQKVLKDLYTKGRELDAVLELISYGNTLNDFRKALEALPSQGTPTNFYSAVQKVWKSILAVVDAVLGLRSRTAASDLIANTFNLLEGAATTDSAALAQAMERAAEQGQVLKNVVENTLVPTRAAVAATGQFQKTLSNEQLKQFNKKVLPDFISTKILFDVGGWWGKGIKAIDEKFVARASAAIQENTPRLATAISWVNNHFGLQSGVVDALVTSKDDLRSGSIIMEHVADYIASAPAAKARDILKSMDARVEALRKGTPLPRVAGLDTRMSDQVNLLLDHWWKIVREISDPQLRARLAGVYNPKTNTWDGGRPFTQTLIVPTSERLIASPTFGEKALTKYLGERKKVEETLDPIAFRTDASGDPVLTDQFIGLYYMTPEYERMRRNGVPLAEIQPDEFISVERFMAGERPVHNGKPMDFDSGYLWEIAKYDGGGVTLTARLNLTDAMSVFETQQLGAAIQNTMHILANDYSSRRLTKALAEYGRGTPNAVAYDSLDDLNATLNGAWHGNTFVPQTDRSKWTKTLYANNIGDISSDSAKSSAFLDVIRSPKSWVRVPEGSDKYGALSGKLVQGSVWAAIQDEFNTKPLIPIRAANNLMRWFKKGNTQYNPGTWGTNIFTNFTMAMLDDIPMNTIFEAARLYFGYMAPELVRKYAGALVPKLTRQEEQTMAKILSTNALIGNFSANEIKEDLYSAMLKNLRGKEHGVASRVLQFAGLEKARIEAAEKAVRKRATAIDDYMTGWYAAQDNVFRIASVLNKLGQMANDGVKIDDEAYRIAGDHARFAFLDYDISAKAVRVMRQTAFPFISWPYAAAKVIGKTAIHKPWKIVNLYAGYWILQGLLEAAAGGDDDETRKVGPEWARNRMLFGVGPFTHVRVPFLGDEDNPVFYNLGKYMAPSSFGDRLPNPFMGIEGWPSALSPGGPFIGGTIFLAAGVDPFTGDPITPPTASSWEAAVERVKYLQSMFTPNVFFADAKEFGKFKDAMADRTDRSDNFSALYLARSLGGLRFYDYNVESAAAAQQRAARAIRGEFDREIARIRRAELRHERPDYERLQARIEVLRERLEKRLSELRGDENDL